MTGSILGMIVLGLIVGAVLALLTLAAGVRGRVEKEPRGIVVTILLGIVGSVVGGVLGRALITSQEGKGTGLVMAMVGALVLLFAYRMTRERT